VHREDEEEETFAFSDNFELELMKLLPSLRRNITTARSIAATENGERLIVTVDHNNKVALGTYPPMV